MKTKNKKTGDGNFIDPATCSDVTASAKSQTLIKVENESNGKPRYARATGAMNEALSNSLMNDALVLIVPESQMEKAEEDPELALKCLDRVEATLKEIAPKDLLEGMIAVQIAGLHEAVVREMHLAANAAQTSVYENRINMVIKLMRTFTSHIEALNRYRGKGQQKVTVEHVTVQQGGQAIVGNVGCSPHGGRGSCDK